MISDELIAALAALEESDARADAAARSRNIMLRAAAHISELVQIRNRISEMVADLDDDECTPLVRAVIEIDVALARFMGQVG